MITRSINLRFGEISVFESFLREIRSENRFSPSKPVRRMIEELLDFTRTRHSIVITIGEVLHRARIHPFDPTELSRNPLPAEEMTAPPPHKARGGRLNPEGIPYLYAASDEATAVAEVRPWTGAAVSVASLPLNRSVTVADFCWGESDLASSDQRRDQHESQEFIWRMVGQTFSIPHHQEDSLRYFPTQYLAEYLKAASFDGVRYDSSLFPGGRNVALFDCTLAEVSAVRRARVTSVHYELT